MGREVGVRGRVGRRLVGVGVAGVGGIGIALWRGGRERGREGEREGGCRGGRGGGREGGREGV